MKLSGTRAALREVVDFLLPAGCVVCRTWIPRRGPTAPPLVCERCRTRLLRASWPRCPRCHAPRGTGRDDATDCLECREWPSGLGRARYAYVLEPPVTDLVHALKYEGWVELAAFMGGAVADVARRIVDADARWIVVPVPTTERRIRSRGYNQAALLAEVVASTLGLPLVGALARRSAPTSQTTLSPRERRENVRDAFVVAEAPAVGMGSRRSGVVRGPGSRVLLVDDVLTTGATAGEAARVLAAAGAASVDLVTFGRALPARRRRAA